MPRAWWGRSGVWTNHQLRWDLYQAQQSSRHLYVIQTVDHGLEEVFEGLDNWASVRSYLP